MSNVKCSGCSERSMWVQFHHFLPVTLSISGCRNSLLLSSCRLSTNPTTLESTESTRALFLLPDSCCFPNSHSMCLSLYHTHFPSISLNSAFLNIHAHAHAHTITPLPLSCQGEEVERQRAWPSERCFFLSFFKAWVGPWSAWLTDWIWYLAWFSHSFSSAHHKTSLHCSNAPVYISG